MGLKTTPSCDSWQVIFSTYNRITMILPGIAVHGTPFLPSVLRRQAGMGVPRVFLIPSGPWSRSP